MSKQSDEFKLVIARHGKAHQESATGRDEDRRLMDRGERQARYLGERIAGLAPGLLLASDVVRAAQTAELILESLACEWRYEPGLRSGRDASEAVSAITSARGQCGEALVLVGHNPQLEELLGVLCDRRPLGGYEMRTGEAVVLRAPRTATLARACRAEDRLRLDEE